jgi:hypothetical protein
VAGPLTVSADRRSAPGSMPDGASGLSIVLPAVNVPPVLPPMGASPYRERGRRSAQAGKPGEQLAGPRPRYARVPTTRQSPDRQLDELGAAGIPPSACLGPTRAGDHVVID